ncbi:MAG: methyltransferase [Paludibacteraceae bacterium]|nr:methyltransferase [Paludibacteraceae bacterium]
MNLGFQFKQFFVRHDRCAMKVGTDGVLLGCWNGYDAAAAGSPTIPHRYHYARCLDIGTGSGLIALMLAQRFPDALIDAIDIDKAAVEQAAENFAASPWSDRLHAFHAHLQEWQSHSAYSLIVSNPPYFQNSLKNPDKGRQTARHTDTLSFSELIHHSTRLLSENGILALILPTEAESEVCELAQAEGLSLTRITRVYSKESKPARRVLLAFGKSKSRNTDISTSRNTAPVEDTLVLEDEIGGRSAAYRELTKDFYL